MVARAANCVLSSYVFRAEVQKIKGFRSTGDSGGEVLARLDAARRCHLTTYRRGGLFGHFMYWDRVDASTPLGGDIVRFNLNTFREDLAFLVGTAIHECAHVAGYKHRWNDRVRHPEILRSVPYQLGFIAERHAPSCLLEREGSETAR